jgi:hypothetical protein
MASPKLAAEEMIRALAGGAHPKAGDVLARGTSGWEFQNLDSTVSSLTAHAASHSSGGTDELLLVNLGGDLPVARITDAVATTDPRLADVRVPSAHAATHYEGGTDPLLLADLSGDLPIARITNGVATTDIRLSNARTPTAHAVSHQPGGTDELAIAWAQVDKTGALPFEVGASALGHTHIWFDVSKVGAVPSDIGAASEVHFHNASAINAGTLDDARLSVNVVLASTLATHEADTTGVHGITNTANIAYKDTDNNFSTAQTFNNVVAVTVRRGTSDGADNGLLTLTGGGSASVNRGGIIQIGGNEHATHPGKVLLYGGASGSIEFLTSNPSAVRLAIDVAGNVELGTAALATTATNGFLYIPTCAGPPTGVPTVKTGRVPIVFDTVNLKMYVRPGGAWIASPAYT